METKKTARQQPDRDGEPLYNIGVMKVLVGDHERLDFDALVNEAVAAVERRLTAEIEGLDFQVFDFSGPHLTPEEGRYSPLDFLRLGLTEKLERGIHFLLVVTEVDLSPRVKSYVLALPSRITNTAIISAKRLSPQFWGRENAPDVTQQRLTTLMLHTIGHLWGLGHSPDQQNVMYNFGEIEKLGQMCRITPEQVARMRRRLPIEAREEVTTHNVWAFALEQVWENVDTIWRTVARANPFRLALNLPTMLTAAFSLIVALFFTPDTWDAVGSISVVPLMLYSLLAIVVATVLLYGAFGIQPGAARKRGMAEATIVSATATFTTLLLTMVLLYVCFFLVGAVSAFVFLPEQARNWGAADLGIPVPEEAQIGMFLAAMGTLAGSLGGRADSKKVVRSVLFLDEES